MAKILILAAALLVLLLAACSGGDSNDDETPAPTNAATGEPASTATSAPPAPTFAGLSLSPATDISLPDGFTAYLIGENFFRATKVAIGPDRTLYVARRHDGVYQLRDTDGDGFFEENREFIPNAGDYDEITGLVVSGDNVVYFGDRSRISTAIDTDGDGTADIITTIIEGIPVGRHQNDGLEFGPDGLLYIGGGSTCDDCTESNPLSAAILRANPDGSGLETYATGIRNSYDIAFDTQGRLWATDNGEDGIDPPYCASIDELNLIEEGADYGWPYGSACDPLNDGTPPVVSLGLHTASTGVDDYSGSQFPAEYVGDLFITLWGSFFAPPELDPELYVYTPGDSEIRPFSTGFVNPIDVLMDRDGTLLVLDYDLGELFRIVYTGG